MNLLRELPPGPDIPNVIYVVVEVPKGSRNKYEYDKGIGFVKLDRVLYSPIHYPGDYGLIPNTHYDDGDPLDVLVMVNEPTFPGCVIEARPIGLFRMLDRGVADDKVVYTVAGNGGKVTFTTQGFPHPVHFFSELTLIFFLNFFDLSLLCFRQGRAVIIVSGAAHHWTIHHTPAHH